MSGVLNFPNKTPKALLLKLLEDNVIDKIDDIIVITKSKDEILLYTTTTSPEILCYMSYIMDEFTRDTLYLEKNDEV